MRDDSATWVDLKVKIEGALLLHLELRGYRSDQDMTVQLNYINDAIVMALEEVLFIPSCTVVISQGWRVCAVSFEVGGQLYACGEGGAVLALDFPLCHFEIRLTAVSSADSLGLDADRLEFKFTSAQDTLNVACGTLAVPATWLVVSRVSGPTLVKNARWCHDHYARMEGPDQVMQLSQIAGIHAHWTAGVTADPIEDTGPRIGAVDVSSHAFSRGQSPPDVRVPPVQGREEDCGEGGDRPPIPRPGHRAGSNDPASSCRNSWGGGRAVQVGAGARSRWSEGFFGSRCISFSLLEESCSTLTHPVASVHDPAQTTCVDRRRRLEVWTEEDTGSQDPRVSSSVGGFRGSWLLSLGSVHAGRGGEHVRFVRAREDFKRV